MPPPPATAPPATAPCVLCGRAPTCVRTFHVMYYVFTDPICERCWDLPSDEWKEDRPWQAGT